MLQFLKYAFDLLLPRECAVCGRTLRAAEKHLCIYCMSDLPLTYYWDMRSNPMADRLNDMIQRDLPGDDGIESDAYGCYSGRISSPEAYGSGPSAYGHPVGSYAYAAALFFYKGGESGYREITRGLKYRGNIAMGRFFSAMLGRKLAASDLFKDVDLVVSVPLHWTRRWQRGYNQAEVIAVELASCLGVPVDARLLKRRRRTRTQTHLGVEEKSRNVQGAFVVRNGQLPAASHILIVDDVFTTGATTNACFKALRARYDTSTRISAATLACVLRG